MTNPDSDPRTVFVEGKGMAMAALELHSPSLNGMTRTLCRSKWGDGRPIRDDKIGSRSAAARVAPRFDFIKKIVTDGTMSCKSEGSKSSVSGRTILDAKMGMSRIDSAERGEPFWRQSREEKDQELIGCNGSNQKIKTFTRSEMVPHSGGSEERLQQHQ